MTRARVFKDQRGWVSRRPAVGFGAEFHDQVCGSWRSAWTHATAGGDHQGGGGELAMVPEVTWCGLGAVEVTC